MNVLIISPTFPNPRCGISTYTGFLADELGQLVKVSILGARDSRRLVRQAVRAAQPADVIHIQHAVSNLGYAGVKSFWLYLRLRRLGKPIATTLHELPLFAINSPKDRLAFHYFRILLRYAVDASDLTWVHTQNTVNTLRQMGITSAHLQVIPHGTVIPRTTFSAGRRPPVSADPVIGFFGFISEHKGIHRVLDVLPQLPGARFVVAGMPTDMAGQTYLARLQGRVKELGLESRVQFLGYIPDQALPDFFASVDLVVFPYEHGTASGTLHLALAHGTPIVASDIPLFREMKATYGCLEIFPLDDPLALVARLRDVATNEQQRTPLILGCQRMIEATNWRTVAQTTAATYQHLLDARLPRAAYAATDNVL